jgi:hypothetical protein
MPLAGGSDLRAVNIALHAVNSALLALLVMLVLGRENGVRGPRRWKVPRALLWSLAVSACARIKRASAMPSPSSIRANSRVSMRHPSRSGYNLEYSFVRHKGYAAVCQCHL